MSKTLRFFNSSSKDLKVLYNDKYYLLASGKQNSQLGDFTVTPQTKVKFGNTYSAYVLDANILTSIPESAGDVAIIEVYDKDTTSMYGYGGPITISVNTSTGEIQSTVISTGQQNIPGLVTPISIMDNLTNKIKSLIPTGGNDVQNIDPVVPQQINQHKVLIIFLVIMLLIVLSAFGLYIAHTKGAI